MQGTSGLSFRGLPALLAAGLCLVSCADPLGSPPICANPDVLAFVANQFGSTAWRPEILPGTIAQYPASSADTVRCTVYVRRVVYDNARYGSLPAIVLEPHFFWVKTLSEGFEITLN